jgi:two-component system LytT family sensor kinase
MTQKPDELNSAQPWLPARPIQRWLVILSAWTLVGFLSAAHWQLFFLQDNPYTWWELLRIKLVLWYLWGGATLLILRLGRRFRPEGTAWRKHLLILTGISVVVVSTYILLYAVAIWAHLAYMQVEYTLQFLVRFVMSRHSTFYYLAFWATLGMDYALEYARRSRQRELQASRLETQLSEARLHALQARLQPHFLFNALNTIASMVHGEKSEEAYDVLTRLSELLRASLTNSDGQELSLGRELEFVQHYLEIVRARFPDRLKYNVVTSDDADAETVPSLILQPLVENAVKHGLREQGSELHLEVRCTRDNGSLLLSVQDNGPGLPPEFDPGQSTGFGISSTRERLANMYGGRATFHMANLPLHGTRVEVRIPTGLA